MLNLQFFENSFAEDNVAFCNGNSGQWVSKNDTGRLKMALQSFSGFKQCDFEKKWFCNVFTGLKRKGENLNEKYNFNVLNDGITIVKWVRFREYHQWYSRG